MKLIQSYNVCFLGRTGNGKSSLINALWNTSFKTDGLVSCTKEMYSVTTMDTNIEGFEAVSVYDTPGIGEFSTDSMYERYYEHVVSIADCIVLVTTFDRTDAPVQRLLSNLKGFINPDKNVKFVIAINHIDSNIISDSAREYQAWDMTKNCPSKQCEQKILERIEVVHKKFDDKFLPFDVVPVCAVRNYGIKELKQIILNQ